VEENNRNGKAKGLKIVITGPESTGKTALAEALAGYYSCEWVPEYAREYISRLGRNYTVEDIEHIASVQLAQTGILSDSMIIFDTWLIITKVWLDVVFNRSDARVDHMIESGAVDLFLLCEPDLPWYPDPVRENGGEARQRLFERYLGEIRKAGYPFYIVSGLGDQRLACAVKGIEEFIKNKRR